MPPKQEKTFSVKKITSASECVKNISEHIRKHLPKYVWMCPDAFSQPHYLETREG